MISGFRGAVNEIFALLECYVAMTGSYRRFGTTYRPHLQGSSSLWTDWPLNMKPTACSETPVTNYKSSLRCLGLEDENDSLWQYFGN